MAKNNFKIIFVLFIVMIFASGCSYLGLDRKSGDAITNFTECAAKYPVMESYPRQCNTPDGGHFVEELTPEQKAEIGEPIVGGDKDEHGCIGSAGYSWCELKNKCLRIWEEPCLPDDEVKAVNDYLNKNISNLSPVKEVLGGKYYVTNTRFDKSGEAVIDYEDGHIAHQAKVIYEYKNSAVKVLSFTLSDVDNEGGTKEPGALSGSSGDCKNYQPETCPAECVVCPPCAECSSISCQTEEFCRSIGFERSWYKSIKNKSGSSPAGGGEANSGSASGIANPASVYCQEQGGQSEIINNQDGSQSGVCKFSDGSVCDEWKFYRKECQPGAGNKTACTMEAKLCPDGSSVGRSGPNCEFAKCP
jgi:putative hemolysin